MTCFVFARSPALIFTGLVASCLLGPVQAQVTTIPLTILVRTNDPARGSGTGLGVPDGRFIYAPPNTIPDYQFAPPVAASGGRYAFQAAVELRFASGVFKERDTGIWGGVQGGPLTMLFRQGLPAPPLGSNFTHYGFQNISELNQVGFFANTLAPAPSDGLWWGQVGTASVAPLEEVRQLKALPGVAPLQSGNFIAFNGDGTNWVYNTDTKELHPRSYTGLPAGIFGPGITMSGPGVLVALLTDGQLLLFGTTSDGKNRLFLINAAGGITPVMSQGDSAPGLSGYEIGLMSVSGNDQGGVAVLVGRMEDGDTNAFNDRAALFAGPYYNLNLIAESPPGVFWGGGTFISRSSYVMGNDPGTGALGIYKLPASPGETLSFTPLPPKPYPPLPGATFITASLNARGQYVELYGSPGSVNQQNPGADLWLFNPGQGWINVARRGSNVVASDEAIPVTDIGFVGNFDFTGASGGGHATGLADDGVLVFSLGTHILATGGQVLHDFYWTGALGPNWHTTSDNAPFTSWMSVENLPRHRPPGDADPDTASVFINGSSGQAIVLDQRPVSIGSLTATNGMLRLGQHLTLNRDSTLHDVRLDPPNGSLTVNANLLLTGNLDWAVGNIGGTGQLLISSNCSLAGTLGLNLVQGFHPGSADTFTILQAGVLHGQFSNAPNGQRLNTIDGLGSFIVNYTPTNVVLSSFGSSLTAPPKFQLPVLASDGTIHLNLSGSPGGAYILQTSTNLHDWVSTSTNNASSGGLLEFVLPRTAEPARFFRALIQSFGSSLAAAPPKFQLPVLASGGTLHLNLSGSPGGAYILQTSTNLHDWVSTRTNNASSGGLLEFVLPRTAERARFFRALTQ